MRYLMLGRLDETKPDAFSPAPEMFAAVQKLGEEMQAAGALVETHGLLPSSTGTRVRSELGTPSVRTGPFDEGIGAISNFAIVEAGSAEEATEWAARFADCVGQEIEVRQLMG
ncbi:MAG TPA: YciI family protein [Candidatus Binatia bacterium]|jgi:hypothetical protein|nr:YciI family protein [Candidatus Binatia bacterium]